MCQGGIFVLIGSAFSQPAFVPTVRDSVFGSALLRAFAFSCRHQLAAVRFSHGSVDADDCQPLSTIHVWDCPRVRVYSAFSQPVPCLTAIDF